MDQLLSRHDTKIAVLYHPRHMADLISMKTEEIPREPQMETWKFGGARAK